MDNYIKDVANNLQFDNHLTKINNNLYLSKKEEDVLQKYQINYKNCDMNSLIYLIEDYLNDSFEELPDLEEISLNISERNYYQNTNK